VEQFLKQGIKKGAFPGLVVLAGNEKENYIFKALGDAEIMPETRSMTLETLFDLASLTKVMVTAPLTLFFIEKGYIRLEDSVSRFKTEFPHNQVTVRQLLNHSSGLPATGELFRYPQDPLSYLWGLELENKPGKVVNYSCMGYILLGKIIEEIAKAGLDELAAEVIFRPLGMEKTGFNPEDGYFAATEVGNEFEQKKGAPPREGVMRGVVHDGNAYSLGGVSGNAGLFAPAEDVGKFARMILRNDGQILSSSAMDLMFSRQTPLDQDPRSMGWCLPGPYSSGGDLISKSSIGHTGFTGTSLWIDLEKRLFIVLLTNRIHPRVENDAHIRLRPLIHNRIWAEMQKKGKEK